MLFYVDYVFYMEENTYISRYNTFFTVKKHQYYNLKTEINMIIRTHLMSCSLVLLYFSIDSTVLFDQHSIKEISRLNITNNNLTENSIQQNIFPFASDLKYDQEELIKLCLTFKPLLNEIPPDIKAKLKTHNILIKDPNAEIGPNIRAKGFQISKITDEQVSLSTSYFKFHLLKIQENKAWARYIFIYTKNAKEYTIPVAIEFIRNDSNWEELNYKILK